MGEQTPYIDQIDAYLRKQLSEEEQRSFDQALADDPALAAALKSHLETLVAIRQKGFQEEIEEGVRELDTELPSQQEAKTRPIIPYRLLAMIAAILLLAVAVWWLIPASQNDSDQLFLSHFYAPAALDLMRGGAQSPPDSLPTPLVEGLRAYQNKAYIEALEDFRAVEGDRLTAAERSWLNLLRGVSFLAESEIDSAQSFLTKADFHPEMADWYLALSEIKAKQFISAQQRLQSIAQDDTHEYQLLAKKLLKDLE